MVFLRDGDSTPEPIEVAFPPPPNIWSFLKTRKKTNTTPAPLTPFKQVCLKVHLRPFLLRGELKVENDKEPDKPRKHVMKYKRASERISAPGYLHVALYCPFCFLVLEGFFRLKPPSQRHKHSVVMATGLVIKIGARGNLRRGCLVPRRPEKAACGLSTVYVRGVVVHACVFVGAWARLWGVWWRRRGGGHANAFICHHHNLPMTVA